MAQKANAIHPWNQCYPWSIPLPFLTTDISDDTDDTDLVRADGAARLAQVRRSVGGHHSLCLNENLLWKTKLSTFAEEKFAEKHSRKLCGEY